MKIEKMEKILNESLEEDIKKDTLIIKNISLIDKLMNILYLELFRQDLSTNDMVGKCKIYSIEERINFVKKFYKDHNIDFNVDELINDGTIGFSYDNLYESEYPETQYEYEINKLSTYCPNPGGHQGYKNEKNLIEIYNTGYLFDSVILIHELSHYRDQFKNSNDISDLFTETLAFVECNIAAKELLSKEEYNYYINRQFMCSRYLISINHILIDFTRLYEELGSVSYENYCLLFGKISKEEYDNLLNDIFINEGKYQTFTCARYVISGLLVPFLLNKYEKDNNFFNVIQELHNDINNCTIKQILSKMGLSFNSEGDIINNDNIRLLLDNLHIFLNKINEKEVIK